MFMGAFPKMRDKELILRLVRFAIAGGTSTALYGIFAFILSSAIDTKFLYIHALSFALAIPFSYMLQKKFTFRHNGAHKQTAWRFLITTGAAFLITSATSFFLVDVWHMAEWMGIVIVMFIVPVISFITMSCWVFVNRMTTDGQQG